MRKINYIYDVGILDWWSDWTPLFAQRATPLSPQMINPITTVEFQFFYEFLYEISKLDWDGKIRNNTEIYMMQLPWLAPGHFQFLVGLKQESNGTTYIGSEFPINASDLMRIISDDYPNLDLVECVFHPEGEEIDLNIKEESEEPKEDNSDSKPSGEKDDDLPF